MGFTVSAKRQPLSEMPSLDSITVSGGSELLPCDFTSLKHLRSLNLHYGRCSMPGLTGLPLKTASLYTVDSLEGLAGLDLHGNSDLCDLSPLASCPGLMTLVLGRR